MAVRNFWLDCQIDGRKTQLQGGPQMKNGGFWLEVFMRHNGQSRLPLVIIGTVTPEGKLELQIDLSKDFQPDTKEQFGNIIQTIATER